MLARTHAELLGIFLSASLLSAASGQVHSSPAFPTFTDVAQSLGVTLTNLSGGPEKNYIVESIGNGSAFLDYDDDQDLDLLITNGSSLEGYRRGGDPMSVLYENSNGYFHNVTEKAGISAKGWGAGVCAADYDNDGHLDFYLTAYGPNVLYRNIGNGRFEDVTAHAAVGDDQWSTNCAFGDYDRDGDVDLYVANYVQFEERSIPRRGDTARCSYMGVRVFCGPVDLPGAPDTLYRNNGDGTFTDVTMASGIEDPGYYGFGVVFSDFDRDGWPDIYVANDAVPNFLFRNNGDGTFSDVSLISGTALSEEGVVQSGMGLDVGDYDGDGDFDIFVTNFARDTNTLYKNMGGLFFVEATTAAGMGNDSRAHVGWGTGFADLDNDGRTDIFIANGHVYPEVDGLDVGQRYRQPKEVYRNLGDGRFERVPSKTGALSKITSARGTAFGDYDNDGDIDVVAINIDSEPNLYRNDGGNQHNWISIRLEGTESNRDAIGARVEIDVNGMTSIDEVRSGGSYLSHNDMRVHFGLGEATTVDQMRVHWPSGRADVFNEVQGNQFLYLREGQGIGP